MAIAAFRPSRTTTTVDPSSCAEARRDPGAFGLPVFGLRPRLRPQRVSCLVQSQLTATTAGARASIVALHRATTALILLTDAQPHSRGHTQAAPTTGARRRPIQKQQPARQIAHGACFEGGVRHCIQNNRRREQGREQRGVQPAAPCTRPAAAAGMEGVVEDGTIVSNAQLDCRLLEGEIIVSHIKRTCEPCVRVCLPASSCIRGGGGLGGEAPVRSDGDVDAWLVLGVSSGRSAPHGRFQMPPGSQPAIDRSIRPSEKPARALLPACLPDRPPPSIALNKIQGSMSCRPPGWS